MQYPIIDTIYQAYIINGWTGLEITEGKNLLNPENALLTDSNAYYGNPNYGLTPIILQPGTYTLSVSDNTVTSGLYVNRADGTNIIARYNTFYLTFTITEETQVVINGYWANNNRENRLLMLEKGSQVTPYEPYAPPKTDIAYRLKLPLPHYFPHPVIDALQRAAAGAQTADDTDILRHYLTPLGIGGI